MNISNYTDWIMAIFLTLLIGLIIVGGLVGLGVLFHHISFQ